MIIGEVIVCLDVNDDTTQLNPTKNFGLFLSKTDLINLRNYRYTMLATPATQQHGSTTIDIILGSLQVAQALRGAFYLPHGELLTLSGDHCTLGVDIDTMILFGNKIPPLMHTYHCGINSNAYPTVPECCKAVVLQCENFCLFEQIETLLQQPKFLPHHHTELKEIDQQLMTILVTTNQKFRKHNNHPWSPTLDKAYFMHRYWMLCLTQK